MTNRQPGFAFGIITALVAWFGLILQQYIIIDNTPGNGLTPLQGVGRFLIFFTVLTNLVIAIGLTFSLLSPASATGRFFARPSVTTATAVYIFIVGLVYNIILRGILHLTGRDRIADEVLHVVVPVLYLAYWYLFAPKRPLRWIQAVYWLWYPALYVVYALIRGKIGGFYAYPFINVSKLGYSRVALNSAVLMIVFLAVSLLFIVITNKLSRQNNPKIPNPAL
jgi:hypothetical protein